MHYFQVDSLEHPSRPRITIQDLAERASDPTFHGRLLPTSPRSVDACLRLGIDPASLRHIPLSAYERWEGDPTLAQLAYDAEEGLRQRRLCNLLEERSRLEEETGAPPVSHRAISSPYLAPGFEDATSGMVEREAQRLEVLRRRQERELAQLVAHEVTRKERLNKAQAKVAALEARAEAQRAARREAAEAWGRQQRERALTRKQQEIEKEKEARAQEAARRAREEAIAAAEAEEAEQRREAARQRCAFVDDDVSMWRRRRSIMWNSILRLVPYLSRGECLVESIATERAPCTFNTKCNLQGVGEASQGGRCKGGNQEDPGRTGS